MNVYLLISCQSLCQYGIYRSVMGVLPTISGVVYHIVCFVQVTVPPHHLPRCLYHLIACLSEVFLSVNGVLLSNTADQCRIACSFVTVLHLIALNHLPGCLQLVPVCRTMILGNGWVTSPDGIGVLYRIACLWGMCHRIQAHQAGTVMFRGCSECSAPEQSKQRNSANKRKEKLQKTG